MSENTYPNHKVWQRKKIAIVVFSFVVFALISISLGYILSTTSTALAQQVDVCDDDPPGGGVETCPCNDCVNNCSGGCMDRDADGICDANDNCAGNETIETTEGCTSYCQGEEDPFTGECHGNVEIECEVTGVYIRCSR